MEKSSIFGLCGMLLGVTAARLILEDSGMLATVLGAAIGGGVGGGLSVLVEEGVNKLKRKKTTKVAGIEMVKEQISAAAEVKLVETKISTPKPEHFYYGFGGWLYLVSVGQLYTLYIALTTIFETDLPILGTPEWDALTNPESADYNALWKPFIYVEIAGSAIFILLILLVGYFTLKLSRYYKRAQISLYIYNIAYSLIALTFMLSLNSHYDPPIFMEKDFTRVITQTTVASIIWIPYFLVSKRVRNTFNK